MSVLRILFSYLIKARLLVPGIFLFALISSSLSPARLIAQNQAYEKYFLFEEYDSIIVEANENIKENSEGLYDFYWLSIAWQKKSNIKKAIEILEEAEKNYSHPLLIKSLAGLYYETGKYPLAKQKYLQLYGVSDTMEDWVFRLSDIYEFENRPDSSLHYLKEYYAIDTGNYRTLIELAKSYNRLNMPHPAINYLLQAEEITPGNYYANRLLANSYLKAEEYDSVIRIASYILREDSTNIAFTRLKAYAYYQKAEMENAVEFYRKSISLGDSSVISYKRLGLALIETEVYDSAVIVLKGALKQDSTDFEIYASLGAAMAQTNDKVKALPYLDKAIDLMQPDTSVTVFILENKANIIRERISYEEGLEIFLEINKMRPGVPRYLYSIGDLYMALEDYESAMTYFEEIMKIFEKKEGVMNLRNELIFGLTKRNIRFIKEEKFFEGEEN